MTGLISNILRLQAKLHSIVKSVISNPQKKTEMDWDVTSSSLRDRRQFSGTRCVHLQNRRSKLSHKWEGKGWNLGQEQTIRNKWPWKGLFCQWGGKEDVKDEENWEKEVEKCSRLSVIRMWIDHRTLESLSY
jgi:hypothetical protein